MREILLDELKERQIAILDVVDSFCRENNIDYWLDSGTLLGAIRHGGYIPWDDDIDIGMLRKDYDSFLKTFNKKNERYKVYSVENNKKFPYPFGKVLDTNTILYEPNEQGVRLAVNIDIFVYDNAPDDDKIVSRMYRKRDFYNRIYHFLLYKTKLHNEDKFNPIKNIVKSLCSKISPCLVCKQIVRNSKIYAQKDTDWVGNFMCVTKIKAPKDIFNEFVEVDFEGKKYKAPIGWHRWLTCFYQNYMKLPPEEKRVSHHLFKAYVDDKTCDVNKI